MILFPKLNESLFDLDKVGVNMLIVQNVKVNNIAVTGFLFQRWWLSWEKMKFIILHKQCRLTISGKGMTSRLFKFIVSIRCQHLITKGPQAL